MAERNTKITGGYEPVSYHAYGIGTVRPSQIITVFGPGAIYDVPNDSIMIKGIDYWSKKYYTEFRDQRLILRLQQDRRFRNVKNFRIPSSSSKYGNVSVITFPSWGECPECHKLSRRKGGTSESNLCDGEHTDGRSYPTHPARLIVACKNGHIDDFPWKEWVPHKKNDCGKNHLYLEKGQASMGLGGLSVICKNCKAKRSLGSALSKDGLNKTVENYMCTGRLPWLEDSERCSETPRGLLRGASNVYFSSTLRGLSIPPFVHPLHDVLAEDMPSIYKMRKNPVGIEILVKSILENENIAKTYTQNQIMEYIQACFDATEDEILEKDVKEDEWTMLVADEQSDFNDFSTEIMCVPNRFRNFLDKLVIIRKLKETVILKGFSRIDPYEYESDGHESGKLAPISSEPPTWLPAIENHGEGIFIKFREDVIRKWEQLHSVKARNNLIMLQHNRIRKVKHLSEKVYSPRYIVLHSTAHLLIRELSNFAGYSSSSIRERVYADKGMAGILLYTSSASSDGSLGGLVSIGKSSTLQLILAQAIEGARICSSDPLCALHNPSSTQRDNGAACHACLFLPETSCESMNTLLDRVMINSNFSRTEETNTSVPGLFAYAASG